ncbi:MAG TPA: transcriptional regulator [Caulobacteraceae bacterium]|jgi:DNA-binding phage protein
MTLTRPFKELVKERAQRDAAFREALLMEGGDAVLAGDLESAKMALRVFINATIGFDALASATGTPAKSLMRMFGSAGNPSARNLLAVLHELQRQSGISLQAKRLEPLAD